MSGIFRLSQWRQDFRPGNSFPNIHAQIWVRIIGLSQEYWHPQRLLEIGRGVGTPFQLDKANKEQAFGYFARILVDVDLSEDLPSSLMVEREGHEFPVELIFESLCSHRGALGHNASTCHSLKKSSAVFEQVTKPESQGQQKSIAGQYRQLYRPEMGMPPQSVVATDSPEKLANNEAMIEDSNGIGHRVATEEVSPVHEPIIAHSIDRVMGQPILSAMEDPTYVKERVNYVTSEAPTYVSNSLTSSIPGIDLMVEVPPHERQSRSDDHNASLPYLPSFTPVASPSLGVSSSRPLLPPTAQRDFNLVQSWMSGTEFNNEFNLEQLGDNKILSRSHRKCLRKKIREQLLRNPNPSIDGVPSHTSQ
ncbi:uncharacterized protein LOC112163749 [Rosa chinensis]|uniref:uncharacterized protein LOC112163749 n=1 Tax=Rosa chinensis TaxID=74649 RepID=UPI000D096958|nr:uncharacterized protein LOC112163749 [Rosa chinensis]